MPYNRVSARKLLNAGEYELFEASTAAALKELTEPRLRQKIERARKLRDKYADLLRRQKISTRSRTGAKAGKSGVANARTGQKQQVFAEALERFEGRLKRIRGAAPSKRGAPATPAQQHLRAKRKAQAVQRASRNQAVSPKAPAKGKRRRTAHGSSAGPATESPSAARQAMKFQDSRSRAIQGHVGATVRRAQARRDRRG